MRLIDADKLHLPPEDIGSRMAVAYAPTAYDVDKVVEELKNKAWAIGDYSNESHCCVDLLDALEIVKRGEINEES